MKIRITILLLVLAFGLVQTNSLIAGGEVGGVLPIPEISPETTEKSETAEPPLPELPEETNQEMPIAFPSEIGCTTSWWIFLLYPLQILGHNALFRLTETIGQNRRYYLLHIALSSVFIYIFSRYVCYTWDIIPTLVISGFAINKLLPRR